MKTEEILRQFEDDLVAGKKPTPAEYEAKYGKIDAETKSLMEVMMGLILLGEEAQLPKGFEERQRKLARDLIAHKKAEEMVAHWQAGEKAFAERDFAKAREHYERLLTFVKYLKDEPWIAFASGRLGNIADEMDETAKALEYYNVATDTYRKLGMKRELMTVLHNIGNIYLIVQKDYPKARIAYQGAIELNEELGATFALPHEYLNLGAIEKALSNNERAEKYYQTALELFRAQKNPQGIGYAEYNLGELMDNNGKQTEAIHLYESAYRNLSLIKDYKLVAQTAGVLGTLYLGQGDLAKSKSYFRKAIEIMELIKEPKPTKVSFTLPNIPEEVKKDPARLLRFLLDKDAENAIKA